MAILSPYRRITTGIATGLYALSNAIGRLAMWFDTRGIH